MSTGGSAVIDRDRFERFSMYYGDLGRYVTGGIVIPAWTPDGTALGFVDGERDARVAWRVDLDTGDKKALFDVDKARAAIAAVTGETPPGRGVPFDRFDFSHDDEICFEIGEATITLNLESYEATTPPSPSMADEVYGLSERARSTPREYVKPSRLHDPWPALEVPAPDGAHLLSVEAGNLVVRSTYDGREVRLTEDGTAEHEWRFDGPSVVVPAGGHSPSPACWSPDGRKVAAYKVDLRGVDRWPQVHYLKDDVEVVYRHAAKAGGVMERTTLYVVDRRGRPPVELDLGDTTDSYPVVAAWLPDSSTVVVLTMSRDCKHIDVSLADAATGRVTPLFSETGESFLRVQHDIYSQSGVPRLGLWLTPDGRHLIWQSERSGWSHFYLYDLDGKLVRQLTDGDWPVEDIVDVRDDIVYFTGHGNQARPYDRHLYRVPIDGGAVEALTDAAGVHTVTLAPSGRAFLDRHSTCDRPPVVEIRTTDGRRLAEISRADVAELERTGYVPPEEFTVTAADGRTELWGAMFRPADFDPARRYPVLEYIYGGPQAVAVPHGFIEGPSMMSPHAVTARALAQLGYVTVLVDARGTPGRSKAFHDASYRRWANVLADDHAGTIRQLAARHDFIDDTRVGIVGGSWGGYCAFRCFVDRPDVYHVAVATCPAFDPSAVLLYECYLDLPDGNPEGYAFADNLALAPRVDGPLMIAVGTSDHLMWTDALKMSEALIRSGKLHEFVVLPEQYHMYDSVHDAYFWRKAAEFLARHLGEPRI